MTIAATCICGYGGYCNGRKECENIISIPANPAASLPLQEVEKEEKPDLCILCGGYGVGVTGENHIVDCKRCKGDGLESVSSPSNTEEGETFEYLDLYREWLNSDRIGGFSGWLKQQGYTITKK